MSIDADTCYRALVARDARFDGLFFVGVKTTGIYCRPICPARTPARERCVFFRRGVEAEREAFRACFRCRPELAPGGGSVDGVPRLVEAAVARIEAGDLNDGTVAALAAALGVTERHLRRATMTALGASPVELAQSRRMALAKQLLQDTSLSMAGVAFASGFASVRRFNALFQARFHRSPSNLRRTHREVSPSDDAIRLRLDYRPPLEWESLLQFFAARAIPGVESVDGGIYRRAVRLAGRSGWIAVAHDPARPALRVAISLCLAGALMPLCARVRALFDLDARPGVIAEHLSADPSLARLVERRPGLRVPGAFDGFETAVRAVLGQQVTVRAATTLSGRIVAALGEPIATPHPGLTHLFPTAETLAAVDEERIARLGLPRSRARTLVALARAAASGGLVLDRSSDVDGALDALVALPGIGDWTAQYLGMRVLRWPDAFPSGDLGLRKALGGLTAQAASHKAEAWRPWRAYAAMHLWTSLTEGAGG